MFTFLKKKETTGSVVSLYFNKEKPQMKFTFCKAIDESQITLFFSTICFENMFFCKNRGLFGFFYGKSFRRTEVLDIK